VAAAAVLILALVGVGAWWMDRQAAERDKERAVATEHDRQEALAALNPAEEVLAAGDLAAADLDLAQAENRLGADSSTDLATLLATAKRDRDLVRDLRDRRYGLGTRLRQHARTGRHVETIPSGVQPLWTGYERDGPGCGGRRRAGVPCIGRTDRRAE
jgi:hypothetical protein